MGFPGGSVVKILPANAGDAGDMDSILGLGRFPGGGNGNPLQYSCLENPHGQRSLVGCSPWGHKESKRLNTQHRVLMEDIPERQSSMNKGLKARKYMAHSRN